jgi:hypothetical protein
MSRIRIRIQNLRILNFNGTPDYFGDTFALGSVTPPSVGPWTIPVLSSFTGSTVVGNAYLRLDGFSLFGDVDLYKVDPSNPRLIGILVPVAVGSVIERQGSQIIKADVNGVAFAISSRNPQILSISDQRALTRILGDDGLWSDINWSELEDPKLRRLCYECACELSTTLDAYYGQNPNGENYCSNCRYKLKID